MYFIIFSQFSPKQCRYLLELSKNKKNVDEYQLIHGVNYSNWIEQMFNLKKRPTVAFISNQNIKDQMIVVWNINIQVDKFYN